ncbi:hypothetical protein [Runella sp. SP2]|uniref:hypothetical protein n=1 Tax=Runella sp. SP2 TaxID=2268026 RepID=UPI000F094B12|nr:hypothetical protein [Runella sp. SP2]AYQ36575.1 hypothetical protein DTQ70_30095 [Runella sp. SP2]
MFSYRIAQTAQEKEDVLSLAQASYSKVHQGSNYKASISAPFFEAIEDTILLLYYQDKLVGTISIFQNKYGGLLPSEYYFGFSKSPFEKTQVEVGRLAKVLDFPLPKEIESKILNVLIWLCIRYLHEHEYTGYICSVQANLCQKLTQLGFEPYHLENVIVNPIAEAFGNYVERKNLSFLHCQTDVCWQALKRLNIHQYLLTIPVLVEDEIGIN